MRLPHQHHNSSEQIAAFMPDAESFGTVSSFFRQLGDPNRIRILWLLCHTEECVVNIAAIIGMSSPAAMHHLKLLKEAGYENGFEFTITVPNNYPPHESTAQVIVENLAEVGITAKINLVVANLLRTCINRKCGLLALDARITIYGIDNVLCSNSGSVPEFNAIPDSEQDGLSIICYGILTGYCRLKVA